ncbi:hypothetical protein SAMN02745163_02238 [Clostridium cavendishii DSM 21758]|uniref:Uncharacterized protein n=1 Tax=Clostridium cavendishii DSM 21758 TaxID=1121302 RepID=A0A1M6KMB2_9CLOT|nr:hypothetical protein SAMN02745163_02238 [Clostridium cavendishii DSM 21758]
MIEALCGLMVFSILASALLSGYDSYLKVKKRNKFNEKAIQYIDIITKEIKYNMNYENFGLYQNDKIYYMKNTNVEDLMCSEIKNFISDTKNTENEVCVLQFIKNDDKHNIKVKISYEYGDYKINQEFFKQEFS